MCNRKTETPEQSVAITIELLNGEVVDSTGTMTPIGETGGNYNTPQS